MAGLTDDGFEIKRLDEIKTEMEDDFKTSFGDDTDVSDESVNGQLIGSLAKPLAEVWELAQAVYSSQDPNQATKISLDRTSQLTAITRLDATNTKVFTTAEGDEATVIDDTFTGKQKDTSNLFRQETGVSVTITKSGCVKANYSINSVQDSHLYTITINGTGYDYTSDADATVLEIMAGLKVSIDAGSEPIDVTDNLNGTLTIDADDFITNFSTDVSAELDIDELGALLELFALDTGTISVPTNTLIEIETPISGLNSINNNLPGITGRAEETDAEFRQRRRDSLKIAGGGTDEAIRTRILQDVDSVTAATIISNRTDVTDGEGRPPHSFEAIVVGGDDAEIALKIWETMPSGIQPYGNVTEIIQDSQGTNQTIKFSRPVNQYIHLDIEIELNAEEVFPVDGITQIKDAIVAYGNTLGTGDDVFQKKLYTPIYTISGIGNVPLLELDATPNPGDSPSFSTDDIPIAESEIAIFSTDRIVVAIV